jgi:hypothetical protein
MPVCMNREYACISRVYVLLCYMFVKVYVYVERTVISA